MARDHQADSGGIRRDAVADPRRVRDRLHPRRELRARGDALPAAARHGGELEPPVDGAGEPHYRRRDPRRGHPVELLARARRRPSAALAAALRDVRRGRVPGDTDGPGSPPRLPGNGSLGARSRGGLPEALHRLQLSDDRARQDAGPDSRTDDAGVLAAAVHCCCKSGRTLGDGELRRGQWDSRAPESSAAHRRPARRARLHRRRRVGLGRHQEAREHPPRRGHRKGGHALGRPRRHRHEHGAERLQLQRPVAAADSGKGGPDVAHRRGRHSHPDDEGAARPVRGPAARDRSQDGGRLGRITQRVARGGTRIAHPSEERQERPAAVGLDESARDRPDGRFAAVAQQRVDGDVAGRSTGRLSDGSADRARCDRKARGSGQLRIRCGRRL